MHNLPFKIRVVDAPLSKFFVNISDGQLSVWIAARQIEIHIWSSPYVNRIP